MRPGLCELRFYIRYITTYTEGMKEPYSCFQGNFIMMGTRGPIKLFLMGFQWLAWPLHDLCEYFHSSVLIDKTETGLKKWNTWLVKWETREKRDEINTGFRVKQRPLCLVGKGTFPTPTMCNCRWMCCSFPPFSTETQALWSDPCFVNRLPALYAVSWD